MSRSTLPLRNVIEQLRELSDDDFKKLVEACDEECITRGWPCAPFEETA